MNLAYKVFHIDGISYERDVAVTNIKSLLSDLPELNVNTVNYAEDKESFNQNYPEFIPLRDFKIGELGVFASNYQAWSTFIDSEYDYLLLFEDDIKLDQDFLSGVKEYISRLPKDWDFFSPFAHWWQKQNNYESSRDDIDDQDICKAYQVWSLASYVVSKNGAIKALDKLKSGFHEPVDWFIFNRNNQFNVYTVKPESNCFCDLLYLKTTIQDEEVEQYPNWFAMVAEPYFAKCLNELSGKPNLKFLQIGTYTGDASVWLMDNILTDQSSYLYDVDTWEGSDEGIHHSFNWNSVEETYDKKVSKYTNIHKHKTTSLSFIGDENKEQSYDFIYIDGDHTEDAVYKDAVASWDIIKVGGIIAFDDYMWTHESGIPELSPGPAIDRFLEEHKDEIDIIEHGYQVWIKRK